MMNENQEYLQDGDRDDEDSDAFDPAADGAVGSTPKPASRKRNKSPNLHGTGDLEPGDLERQAWTERKRKSRSKGIAEDLLIKKFNGDVGRLLNAHRQWRVDPHPDPEQKLILLAGWSRIGHQAERIAEQLRDHRNTRSRSHKLSSFFLNLPLGFCLAFSPSLSENTEEKVHQERIDKLSLVHDLAFRYQYGCTNKERLNWMKGKDLDWFELAMATTVGKQSETEEDESSHEGWREELGDCLDYDF